MAGTERTAEEFGQHSSASYPLYFLGDGFAGASVPQGGASQNLSVCQNHLEGLQKPTPRGWGSAGLGWD